MWSTCKGIQNMKIMIRIQIVFCLFTVTFAGLTNTNTAAEHHYGSAFQRSLNDHSEEELPDAILLPGFLALTVADMAGYLVSSIAYNLSRAIMFIFWF
jgi:hypothetical protein